VQTKRWIKAYELLDFMLMNCCFILLIIHFIPSDLTVLIPEFYIAFIYLSINLSITYIFKGNTIENFFSVRKSISLSEGNSRSCFMHIVKICFPFLIVFIFYSFLFLLSWPFGKSLRRQWRQIVGVPQFYEDSN